jgi:hypothetical protein
MTISRRAFLETLGIGTGAVMWHSVGGGIGIASSPAPRRFVFAHVAGGWDTLMSLDPRDPDTFTDARASRTGVELAWSRLAAGSLNALTQPAGSAIVLGPMAADFARHVDKACIVNGIAVDATDHDTALRAISPPAQLFLDAHPSQAPLPHLACRVAASGTSARVESVDELADTDERLCPGAALSERYGVRHPSAGEAQAAMAVAALRHDLAQCVSIQLATGLDTHGAEWATVQPRRQREAFRTLALLVDDLERDGSLASTTVVVFSEFGRAARLNARGGRDHGRHASALLIGAGVPHNRVVGATSDTGGLQPLHIDARSGRPTRRGGVALTPSRLWASVLASAGAPRSALEADPLPCLMA